MTIKQTCKAALLAALYMTISGTVRAEDAPKPLAPAEAFAGKCSSCHGKDGKGNAAMVKTLKFDPAALDLTDAATAGKTDADLTKVILGGLNKMPAYQGKLTDEQVAGVVTFIRGLASPKTEAKPDGAALYAKCVVCHGKDAKGDAAKAKAFHVDPAALDLLDKDTLAKTDAEIAKITLEGLNKMPAYKGKLTEDEVAAVAKYLRAQAK